MAVPLELPSPKASSHSRMLHNCVSCCTWRLFIISQSLDTLPRAQTWNQAELVESIPCEQGLRLATACGGGWLPTIWLPAGPMSLNPKQPFSCLGTSTTISAAAAWTARGTIPSPSRPESTCVCRLTAHASRRAHRSAACRPWPATLPPRNLPSPPGPWWSPDAWPGHLDVAESICRARCHTHV